MYGVISDRAAGSRFHQKICILSGIMRYLVVLALLLIPEFLSGQSTMEISGEEKAEVSFELSGNLIFIPVKIDGKSLIFLLDTGSKHTILFGKQHEDTLLQNVKKIKFKGFGGEEAGEGLKSKGDSLKIGENIKIKDETIFLIQDNDFGLSTFTGIPVNGILGSAFFKDHPMKLDYKRKKIVVYKRREVFNRAKRRAEQLNLILINRKPFFNLTFETDQGLLKFKAMIDSGHAGNLWVVSDMDTTNLFISKTIEDQLGVGVNGEIRGLRGRVRAITIKDFNLENPVIALPEKNSIKYISLPKTRQGILGGGIMRRFIWYLDFPRAKAYLVKNSNFKEPFYINMSGLEIKYLGKQWKTEKLRIPIMRYDENGILKLTKYEYIYDYVLKKEFEIAKARKGSPGYKAGIRKGDKVISVNGKPSKNMTLGDFRDLMGSEEFRSIRMVTEREGIQAGHRFKLKDPIPLK